ncbi:MAG: glycosyltransferase family 4 protein, partial [Bifidobacteriaceae bacterium]|nr:glycosyltransferase family 4 protein [Bifidobacteriaceae bacterium]
MAVGNAIAADARVLKTARSVRQLGYQVTLLWPNFSPADEAAPAPLEGEFDGVRTLGLPVSEVLAARAEARQERLEQAPAAGIGYRSASRRDLAAARLAARAAALPSQAEPVGLKLARRVHAGRSRAFDRRSENRLRRRTAAVAAPGGWRRALGRIADLDRVFVPALLALEPDIIHAHDIGMLSAGAHAKRRLAARGRPARLIYDAHEYVAGQIFKPPLIGGAYTTLERELISQADAVVTVADGIADRLQAEAGLAVRPTVVLNVPLAANPAAGAPGRSVRQAAGVGPQCPLVVYSGRIEPARNVEVVIRALAWLPGVHLAVVCVPNSATWRAGELRRLIWSLGLADRVSLLDPVPTDQVVSFLASASLGVHPMITGVPNHELALPNKLFDYLHAGLPVALSQNRAMARFVKETGVGLAFDPDSPPDAARAVRQILAKRADFAARVADPELLRQYSWQAQAAKLAALYRQLDPAGPASPTGPPDPPDPPDPVGPGNTVGPDNPVGADNPTGPGNP